MSTGELMRVVVLQSLGFIWYSLRGTKQRKSYEFDTKKIGD
jgi:hypothetical protein